MTTLSAHQVNFCPYGGFFQKVAGCDIFVLMSHCQWEKGGYQNRFKVGEKWHTMSTNRGLELLKDKRYVNAWKDWCKIISDFRSLDVFSECISDNLTDTNSRIIIKACDIIGLTLHRFVGDETAAHLTGTERLINLCKTFGADRYLSGISGKNYLDLSRFADEGIEVVFQDESKLDKRPLYELIA